MRYPKKISSLDDFYNAIEKSETYKKLDDSNVEYTKKFSGYYPIGSGNLWHSGVHIEYESGEIVYPIIPGGKVIAFRLEDNYQDCLLPEKITINQVNNEYSHYLELYEEKDEDGFKYYELKTNLSEDEKTYSVSNNFILFKHEINVEQLETPLIFYSLYMNLAPVNNTKNPNQVLHTKENPFYPDSMCSDSNSKELKRGFQQLETPEELKKIGKAGFLRGKRYVDFCIFTEKSLTDGYKEKTKVSKKNLVFHHINTGMELLKKGEKEKSKKIYWPTGTDFVIDETEENENGKAVKFHISRIRPYFENGKKDIDYQIIDNKLKVLKTDKLQLTDKKIDKTGLKFSGTDFVLTKTLLNCEFEKTGNSVVAFFVPEVFFEKITYWYEGEKPSPDANKEVNVYTENPLLYSYSPINSLYKTYENLIKIKEFDLQHKITTKNQETVYKVIGLLGSDNEDLFIKEQDALQYYESAFDWEKWFFNIPDDNEDIVCDRTGAIKYWINEFNKGIDYGHLADKYLEEWWYGTLITDEYLKNALTTDGMGYEFAKNVRKMFRKATCYHPLEWDKTLFDNSKINKLYQKNTGLLLSQNVKESLINESTQADIWDNSLNKIFRKNCFYFVNPVYFCRHLEKAKIIKSCLCEEDWTYENLTEVGINEVIAKNNIDSLNETFKKFELNSCLRKAHFLAQIMHESGCLTATKEKWPKENAKYRPFIGRGFIQITWESNYKAYGKYINEDVYTYDKEKEDYKNLEKLESPPHAMLSAGWFWDTKALNNYADSNDLIEISRRVNGGFNGYEDRLNKLINIKDKIIKECSKVVFDTNYILEKSDCYNSAIGCFAWAVWHDKDGGKTGCTYDVNEAIKGYKRCIELGSTEVNYYGIEEKPLIYGETDKNGDLLITDASTFRLKELEKK